jgi:hypothetical protein
MEYASSECFTLDSIEILHQTKLKSYASVTTSLGMTVLHDGVT